MTDIKHQTIDFTPTWGEIGKLYSRLAETGERKAAESMRSDVARAFAAAQALQNILRDLPDHLKEVANRTLTEEMLKQGFDGRPVVPMKRENKA